MKFNFKIEGVSVAHKRGEDLSPALTVDGEVHEWHREGAVDTELKLGEISGSVELSLEELYQILQGRKEVLEFMGEHLNLKSASSMLVGKLGSLLDRKIEREGIKNEKFSKES